MTACRLLAFVGVVLAAPLLAAGTGWADQAARLGPSGTIALVWSDSVSGFTDGPWVEEIVLIDANGRNKRTITRHRRPSDDLGLWAWTPDGRRIVYHRYNQPNEGTYVLDVDGREEHRLRGVWANRGEWSPDGRLFVAGDGHGIIVIRSSDGTILRRLTRNAADEHPKWSPDGTRIAFHRSRRIYTMKATGRNVRPLQASGWFDWALDGKSLIVDGMNSGGLWRVATDRQARKRLTVHEEDASPSISPDGRWVAFVRYPDIWVMRVDGSDKRRVLSCKARAECWNPVWSPVG